MITPKQILTLKRGDQVLWSDPDEQRCSRVVMVERTSLHAEEASDGDFVLIVDMEGNYLECTVDELTLLAQVERDKIQLLVEALRSEQYEQTTHALARGFKDASPTCFCVDGIACEVYRQHTGKGKWAFEYPEDVLASDTQPSTISLRSYSLAWGSIRVVAR